MRHQPERVEDLTLVCAGCGETLTYQRFRFWDDPRHIWPDNNRPLMHGDHETGVTYDREHYAYVLDRK